MSAASPGIAMCRSRGRIAPRVELVARTAREFRPDRRDRVEARSDTKATAPASAALARRSATGAAAVREAQRSRPRARRAGSDVPRPVARHDDHPASRAEGRARARGRPTTPPRARVELNLTGSMTPSESTNASASRSLSVEAPRATPRRHLSARRPPARLGSPARAAKPARLPRASKRSHWSRWKRRRPPCYSRSTTAFNSNYTTEYTVLSTKVMLNPRARDMPVGTTRPQRTTDADLKDPHIARPGIAAGSRRGADGRDSGSPACPGANLPFAETRVADVVHGHQPDRRPSYVRPGPAVAARTRASG